VYASGEDPPQSLHEENRLIPLVELSEGIQNMTHLAQIWDCIVRYLPRRQWVQLDDIYRLIEHKIDLDAEDYEWQSPSSDTPKWKRNVRNVLQYRRKTGDIEWDGSASYRL